MRARRAVILGVLVAGLAAIAYIMRGGRDRSRYTPPPVQLGLADGTVKTFDLSDPAALELRDLAAAVGRAMEVA